MRKELVLASARLLPASADVAKRKAVEPFSENGTRPGNC
jgi:hypothetical protein